MHVFFYLHIYEDMENNKFIYGAIWALRTSWPECLVRACSPCRLWQHLGGSCGTPCVFGIGVTNAHEEIHPAPPNKCLCRNIIKTNRNNCSLFLYCAALTKLLKARGVFLNVVATAKHRMQHKQRAWFTPTCKSIRVIMIFETKLATWTPARI